MHGTNVLPLFSRPREKDYRAAVAKIIRTLKAQHNLSNTELAEEIGCSPETIGNAENEHNNLNPVTLGNIRWRFGAAAVRPWDDACDAQVSRDAPRTLFERLDDALAELDAVRREMGDGVRAA